MKRIISFLLLLIFIVFSFPQLVVVTEPNSMVYWNNVLLDTVPSSGVLKLSNLQYPGILKVIKPGFAPFETEVSTDMILKIKLSLPSYLEITSYPENVNIFFNGKFIGVTPGVFEFPSGNIELYFEKEGYIPKKLNISLEPSQIEKINISLNKYVKLKLISNKKIEAILDNDYVNLPTEVNVLPGKHVLKLIGKDFVTNIQEINVPVTEEFEYVVDDKIYVRLYVYGYPENAMISLNGISKLSPAAFKIIPGTYNIRIESEGFEVLEQQIEVSSENPVFRYSLKKRVISNINKNLTVFLDGYEAEGIFVPKKLYFTKIISKNGEWYGFTDGSVENIPKSLSVFLGSEGYLEYKGIRYNSPTLLNVFEKETVKYVTDEKVVNFIVNQNLVLDDSDHCLVNIYSKEVYDVKVDGKMIGRTPIYLLILPSGTHNFKFLRNGVIVHEKNVEIKQGILNEIFGGD